MLDLEKYTSNNYKFDLYLFLTFIYLVSEL